MIQIMYTTPYVSTAAPTLPPILQAPSPAPTSAPTVGTTVPTSIPTAAPTSSVVLVFPSDLAALTDVDAFKAMVNATLVERSAGAIKAENILSISISVGSIIVTAEIDATVDSNAILQVQNNIDVIPVTLTFTQNGQIISLVSSIDTTSTSNIASATTTAVVTTSLMDPGVDASSSSETISSGAAWGISISSMLVLLLCAVGVGYVVMQRRIRQVHKKSSEQIPTAVLEEVVSDVNNVSFKKQPLFPRMQSITDDVGLEDNLYETMDAVTAATRVPIGISHSYDDEYALPVMPLEPTSQSNYNPPVQNDYVLASATTKPIPQGNIDASRKSTLPDDVYDNANADGPTDYPFNSTESGNKVYEIATQRRGEHANTDAPNDNAHISIEEADEMYESIPAESLFPTLRHPVTNVATNYRVSVQQVDAADYQEPTNQDGAQNSELYAVPQVAPEEFVYEEPSVQMEVMLVRSNTNM